MHSMDTDITTIKLHIGTRKKLKLLAAMMDKTVIDLVEQLADEALKKVQASGNSQGVQVSDISNRRSDD